jgi:DNA-binding transcriptional MerR regulator
MYSIGHLAKISDMTVRTLRYYDEIGLLKPTTISKGGHRQYDDDAVEKLQNIMFLKEIGFDLETIRSILNENIKSSRELLQLRLEFIAEEQARLEKKKKKIHAILDVIDLEGKQDWEVIFQALTQLKNYDQETVSMKWDKLFTKEEQDILQSMPKIGDNSSLSQGLIQLVKEIKEHVHIDPASDKAQQLAREWNEIGKAMYQGNAKLAQKVWKLQQDKTDNLGFYDFDPELVNFIEKMQTHYYKKLERESSDE